MHMLFLMSMFFSCDCFLCLGRKSNYLSSAPCAQGKLFELFLPVEHFSVLFLFFELLFDQIHFSVFILCIY